MATTDRAWWQRWRRRATALVVLQAAYVGSYAALYHRGVSEADAIGSSYFFYVPADDVIEARGLTRRHLLLMVLFDPLNELHCEYLGGRSACRCMLFGLSKEPPEQAEADSGAGGAGEPDGQR